ncbi:MAG TPA: cyclic nucleotide-binding domain-containing protein [Geminicoccaceae bacterium]|nr:cyclic nucleotide-binding domain-containing protein [Geminicoccaceae bacterium]
MLLTIEKVIILKSVEMFSGVPDDVLADVAHLLRSVDVPAGETIIREGEIGSTLYIIVDGRMRVHRNRQTIAELGERDVFGELAVLDPEPRSASIEALEDARLLELRGDHLEELMATDLAVVRGIIRFLCRRIRATTAR